MNSELDYAHGNNRGQKFYTLTNTCKEEGSQIRERKSVDPLNQTSFQPYATAVNLSMNVYNKDSSGLQPDGPSFKREGSLAI